MSRLKLLILRNRIKRAKAKRDTLLDENKIDAIDEKIWKLSDKYAKELLKEST